MEFERRILPFLFVVSGTLNVLLIKWNDNLLTEGSDGKLRKFQHPVLQTAVMFLGQIACFIVYKIVHFFLQRRGNGSEDENVFTRGGREFSPISLLLPAFLDTVASVLLFTGLYLTYVSSFQMIRGAAIIFVGIFGAIYLNQTLTSRHWMAIITILCGVSVILSVDVHRVYYDNASLSIADANSVLTGNLLIICAQIFHAAQFVYEEKHLKGSDMPPLQAAGWQGIFGFLITIMLAVCMNFLPAQIPFGDNSRGVFDDLGDAMVQMRNSPVLFAILGVFGISCALYNYAGLSIVKFSSAITRLLADELRIMLIWAFALLLEWEYLNLISIMGFVILWIGTISYRNAIFLEWYRSLLAALARRRYVDLSVDHGNEGVASRPADVI